MNDTKLQEILYSWSKTFYIILLCKFLEYVLFTIFWKAIKGCEVGVWIEGRGEGAGSGPVFAVHSLLTTVTETSNSPYVCQNISYVPMRSKTST